MQGYSICTVVFGVCQNKKCKNEGLMRMGVEESLSYARKTKKKFADLEKKQNARAN